MARKGRIFLCHNSHEKEAAKKLAFDMLFNTGLRAWIDTWEIPGGQDWEKHIRTAFASSSSCLILLGAAGFGPYQRIEIGWAKERQALDPDYRTIPVLFPGVTETELAALEELLPKIHWIDLRGGWDHQDALHPIWNALKGDGPGPPLLARNVAVAAEDWDRLGRRDKSTLIRGAALRKAQSLAQESTHPFDELSLEFLAASAAEQQRKTRLAVIGLTALLIALASGALFVNSERQKVQQALVKESEALTKEQKATKSESEAREQEHVQRQRAEDRQRLATARELAAKAQLISSERADRVDLSMLLAAESLRLQPGVEADLVIRNGLALTPIHQATLARADSPIGRVLESTQGQILVGGQRSASTKQTTVELWRGSKRLWRSVQRGNGAANAFFDLQHSRVGILSDDGWFSILDVGSGRITLPAIPAGDYADDGRMIQVSPNMQFIATRIANHNLEVRRVGETKPFISHHHRDSVLAFDFSPDSSYLAVSSSNEVTIWDLKSGQTIECHPGTTPTALHFAPNSNRYVAATPNGAVLYAVGEAKPLATVRPNERARNARFSPRGDLVAVSSDSNDLQLWALDPPRVLAHLPHGGVVQELQFNESGGLLATLDENRLVRIWGPVDSVERNRDLHIREIARVPGANGSAAFRFMGNGSTLAIATSSRVETFETNFAPDIFLAGDFNSQSPNLLVDSEGHHVFMANENVLSRVDCNGNVISRRQLPPGRFDGLKLAGDDSMVGATVGHSFALFNGRTLNPITSITADTITAPTLGPHGTSVVYYDFRHDLVIQPVHSGQLNTPFTIPAPVDSFVIDPAGQYLIVRSRNLLTMHRLDDGHLLRPVPSDGAVSSVAIDPTGTFLAEILQDGSLLVLSLPDCVIRSRQHLKEPAELLAWSPTAPWLALGTQHRSLQVVDWKTGAEVANIPHSLGPAGAVFSRDGTRLATRPQREVSGEERKLWELYSRQDLTPSLTAQDTSVRVFDTATWTEVSRVLHSGFVSDIQISHNGRLLISYSDRQVRVSTLDPEALAELAISRVGRSLTESEKEMYLKQSGSNK